MLNYANFSGLIKNNVPTRKCSNQHLRVNSDLKSLKKRRDLFQFIILVEAEHCFTAILYGFSAKSAELVVFHKVFRRCLIRHWRACSQRCQYHH